MATLETRAPVHEGHPTVFVERFTNGVIGPSQEMLGPVEDGGHIVVNTAPGCWGPMITPKLRGGHEVAQPVAVAGAEPGDAVAIRIRDIVITSIATASGNDRWIEGRFDGDPYCARMCAGCGTPYPETRLDGIGQDAVRCANCGADATPFKFTNGYTIAFDEAKRLGVTLDRAAAEEIAGDAAHYAALPENSVQHPILAFAPNDLVGVVARLRPFMGQLGTSPSADMPDSHNAGDFGSFLVGAPHAFAMSAEELMRHKTDGHMDVDAVRAGAILICPVKLPGGGIYLGDMHALQGDGEIAGHTCDVAGTATLQVELIKGGLGIDGPVLMPMTEDLPYLARPLSEPERVRARTLAARWGLAEIEESAPISVIGTGPDLNAATDNGLERAATLLDMTVPEVKNRATISGSIQIGRHPGVVRVTFRAPMDALERRGLADYAREMYGGE